MKGLAFIRLRQGRQAESLTLLDKLQEHTVSIKHIKKI